MKYFEHVDAITIEEASEQVRDGAKIIAGGTDILGVLKDKILPEYPSKLINIKSINGMDKIEESGTGISIGANVKLSKLAENETVKSKYAALSQAASSVATPLIRNQATLGGNICQDVRCWYYRYPNQIGGRLECARKDGDKCYALTGENKYHSIFGGMRVHQSACSKSCPAHVNIPQYLERVRANDLDGAAEILMLRNPLAAVTSRVCSHFCMQGCGRDGYDERVNIGQIERYVGDYILDNASRLMPPPEKETGKKIGIIGAGPAALTAAYYLRKAGHSVTVLDKMDEPGGLLMYAIPEYRLPKDKVRQLTKAIAGMGVEFRQKVNIGEDVMLEDVISQYDSVFLDTGAWKNNIIGIDNEDLTIFGLDFLVDVKMWMKDKPGQDIIVVGGGNVAMDVAVTAKRLGAKNVTLAFRKPESELSAAKEEIEKAKEEGVMICECLAPKAVLKENGKVSGMEFMKCSAHRDEAGKLVVVPDEQAVETISADAIILAVGQKTDLSYLDERLNVAVEKGKISVEESQATSKPGVFAGGDVTTGPSTVVNAVAAGYNAALSIADYLGMPIEEIKLQEGFVKRSSDCLTLNKSVEANILPAEERTLSKEDDQGLPFEAVEAEAHRCFNCSCYAVAPSDTATALMTLNAVICTTEGKYSADEFFTTKTRIDKVLQPGEIVTGVEIPESNAISAYDKFRERESIDFAMVGLGTAYDVKDGKINKASIVMGAVAPVPMRAEKAEKFLEGKDINEANAAKAAELALEEAEPLAQNAYKIQIAKALIEKSILNLA